MDVGSVIVATFVLRIRIWDEGRSSFRKEDASCKQGYGIIVTNINGRCTVSPIQAIECTAVFRLQCVFMCIQCDLNLYDTSWL
jgi:hypothetical protein